ncbi:MAG: HlyD family efflux transporter periplasmic adaptor subunit, partial [Bacteroidota bacterium]
ANISSILVEDKASVEQGQYLILFANDANNQDILLLNEKLDLLHSNPLEFYENEKGKKYNFGFIQPKWDSLIDFLREYYELTMFKKYDNKIARYKKERQILLEKNDILANIINVDDDLKSLDQKAISRNSQLYDGGLISTSDLENRERQFLGNQKAVENQRIQKTQNQLDIVRVENAIQDLSEAKREDAERLKTNINIAYNSVRSAISVWEERNVLKSPIDGSANFLQAIKENQYINVGTPLLTITPQQMEYTVEVEIPFTGAGLIEIDQDVNLKLSDYPYQEFGMLKGSIKQVSDVASKDFYVGQIELKNKNITSYKKPVTLKENSTGIAEIITKRRSLLSRIFEKIIYAFNN